MTADSAPNTSRESGSDASLGAQSARSGSQSRLRRPRAPQRRRVSRRAKIIVAVWILVLWIITLAFTGLGVVRSRSHLAGARDALESARANFGTLVNGDAAGRADVLDDIVAAGVELRAAKQSIDRSPIRLAGSLPLVGSQVGVVDDIIDVASTITAVAELAVEGIDASATLPDNTFIDVESGTVVLGDLEPAVSGLQRGENTLLGVVDVADRLRGEGWGPLGDAATQVADTYDEVRSFFTSARSGLELLPGTLGYTAPKTYLLALRNPAELTADGGMMLTYAPLRIDAGRITIEAARPTSDLVRPGPIDVEVPDWYRKLAPLRAMQDVRRATVTAQFPTAANVTAAIYASATGKTADGVIAIDPVAIRAVLDATGPVTAQGTTVDAGNVVDITTNAMYATYPGNVDRDAFVSAVMTATTNRLIAGNVPLMKLGRGLGDAAAAGHIQIWMADPADEPRLAELGLGGELVTGDGDYLRPAVQNHSGNKLDYFIERKIRHELELNPDGGANARTEITLTNAVPPGQPAVVIGGSADRGGHYKTLSGLSPGDHRARVGIYVPADAQVTGASADALASRDLAVLDEGGVLSLTQVADIAAGESRTFVFEYNIPSFTRDWRDGTLEVVLQPQGLHVPETVEVVVKAADHSTIDGVDIVDETVELSGTTVLDFATQPTQRALRLKRRGSRSQDW